jgi:hypothetical protein
MKITSQVKISRKEFEYLANDSLETTMDMIRSDMAIAFTKELLKNTGLVTSRNWEDMSIFEMQAIVIDMKSFGNLMEFLALHLSPESMRELRNDFINKL